uniref:Uncharacterized protein n=1 Tax=Romanomermis culicivorax TaxID=13658 RepID=A0A915IHJ5_ROMCU
KSCVQSFKGEKAPTAETTVAPDKTTQAVASLVPSTSTKWFEIGIVKLGVWVLVLVLPVSSASVGSRSAPMAMSQDVPVPLPKHVRWCRCQSYIFFTYSL